MKTNVAEIKKDKTYEQIIFLTGKKWLISFKHVIYQD